MLADFDYVVYNIMWLSVAVYAFEAPQIHFKCFGTHSVWCVLHILCENASVAGDGIV